MLFLCSSVRLAKLASDRPTRLLIFWPSLVARNDNAGSLSDHPLNKYSIHGAIVEVVTTTVIIWDPRHTNVIWLRRVRDSALSMIKVPVRVALVISGVHLRWSVNSTAIVLSNHSAPLYGIRVWWWILLRLLSTTNRSGTRRKNGKSFRRCPISDRILGVPWRLRNSFPVCHRSWWMTAPISSNTAPDTMPKSCWKSAQTSGAANKVIKSASLKSMSYLCASSLISVVIAKLHRRSGIEACKAAAPKGPAFCFLNYYCSGVWCGGSNTACLG